MNYYKWNPALLKFEEVNRNQKFEKKLIVGVPVYGSNNRLEIALTSLFATEAFDETLVIISIENWPHGKTVSDPISLVALMIADSHFLPEVLLIKRNRILRLGKHWNRILKDAQKFGPNSKYFAWASDHDEWPKGFFQSAIEFLDANPNYVAFSPNVKYLNSDGTHDTPKIRPQWKKGISKLSANLGKWSPGNSIYSVFRFSALRGRLKFRQIFLPDRLFVLEVAIQGPFASDAENREPWVRYLNRPPSFDFSYQRSSVIKSRILKVFSYVPWPIVHSYCIFLDILSFKFIGRRTVSRKEIVKFLIEQGIANYRRWVNSRTCD
jgi:hypothetical protein